MSRECCGYRFSGYSTPTIEYLLWVTITSGHSLAQDVPATIYGFFHERKSCQKRQWRPSFLKLNEGDTIPSSLFFLRIRGSHYLHREGRNLNKNIGKNSVDVIK